MRTRAAMVVPLLLGLLGGAAATFWLLRSNRSGDETQRQPDAGARQETPSPTVPAVSPAMAESSARGPAVPDPTTPAKAARPEVETVAAIEAAYAANKHATDAELKRIFARFVAAGPAGAPRATELAKKIAYEVDPEFEPAHALLGHKKFDHEMPEIISFRKYDYLRIVEDAIEKRWIDDPAEFAAAEAAWTKTLAHARRLEYDPTFRALDGARREIARDFHFKDFNYAAAFASPYLVCYSSSERVSDEELSKLSRRKRQQRLAELEVSRAKFAMRAAEKATILQQFYREFLRRYGESCDLKDLMSPYGGRPDLAPGKRSYEDGCPLVVWVFEDRNAWDEFHLAVRDEPAVPTISGYFMPATGWVYLYDEEMDHEFEIDRTLEAATGQLLHCFGRQKRNWGNPVVPGSFFGVGFAAYLGAVTMSPDRSLTFHGVNRARVSFLRSVSEQAKSVGQKVQLFPLDKLAGFEGYGAVEPSGAKQFIPEPLGVFYAQSWAFVYFLNEALNHKYQAKFTGFLSDML
jgi:hypothetical protein